MDILICQSRQAIESQGHSGFSHWLSIFTFYLFILLFSIISCIYCRVRLNSGCSIQMVNAYSTDFSSSPEWNGAGMNWCAAADCSRQPNRTIGELKGNYIKNKWELWSPWTLLIKLLWKCLTNKGCDIMKNRFGHRDASTIHPVSQPSCGFVKARWIPHGCVIKKWAS